ncbi:MarR family transcriptional regulator [Flagellimonas lutimaris]|uniref:MarR family transcriptional regulator n=1 Tax=Flagellimonas lutimaris TaxID=475082 RepID=A0A3A1NAW8_9FLAO|nr:MarR family transcriptional regulator [Allomuricauda lutimaris]RIV36708.1 MarR family transcriptional regulator [Allomuricauda lutimaris]
MDEQSHDIVQQLAEEWERERPGLDVSPMKIVGRILSLGRILEKRIGKVLQSHGIHYSDLDVLATLRRSGSPYALSPKELMESVLITSGAMTALLNRLVKLGLIYRMPDAKDRRSTLACLTEKGKDLIDEVIVVRFEEAADAIEMFNEKEKRELALLLAKMSKNIALEFTFEN